MNASTKRVLEVYSTSGCHLCEQALDMLAAVAPFPIEVEEVDIAVSAPLVEQYGMRIPVFRAAGSEIDWPFSPESLRSWLIVIFAGEPSP